MKQTPHVAFLLSPGMGHMIPMLELAKKFTHQNISSTLIVPDSGLHPDEEKLFLESLPKGIINLIHLPKPNLDDVQTDPIGVIIFTIARSLPSIRDAIRSLVATTNLVALVTDLMGSAAFDVARELDVLPYMFFPSNATVLSLYLYLPELDPNISCAYKDLAGPVQIPGCMPLRADDLFEAFKDRDSFAYKWIISEGRAYRTAAGVLVNTFDEMESGAIKALQQNEHYPPVYPVGPIVRPSDEDKHAPMMIKWLDQQPIGSVLFVSFGSLGSLSQAQIKELAFGLEMSEKNFLWVVRNGDLKQLLPVGFLDRIVVRGLIVSDWAPQARILSHSSTGGFLSHCGWNSVMESVANGVPMIAWPLKADQKMNAALLSEELKIAIRIQTKIRNCKNAGNDEDGEEGLIGRNEIAGVVESLMEGEPGKELRKRARGLMQAAKLAVNPGGQSAKSLLDFVLHLDRN